MAQFNALEIRSSFRGCVRTYYSYDDELYAGTFPEEWAQNHAPGTGPKECENCRDNGCWNGVFMGYCGNCAIHVYNGTRGKGFISPGEEFDIPENREFESVFDTYLYDVNLHDVGDTDFCDSLANAVNRYASEFIHRNPRDVLAGFKRMEDDLCGNGEDHVDYVIDTNGTPYADVDKEELFLKYDGQGYSQADIDYVIAANSRRLVDEEFVQSDDEYDYDYDWNSGRDGKQYYHDISNPPPLRRDDSLNTQESVPDPDMFSDESDAEPYTEADIPLDETVHCMICENTKYNCACDEDIIHESVFCYTCENPRYVCECDEESRNKTHCCLHCEKVKYNCICVGENSVYLRVARKYCMQQQQCRDVIEDENADQEYVPLKRFIPPNTL